MAGGDDKQSRREKVSVGYHLFLYREELRRAKVKALRLSKAKYQLTTDLVVISWNDITSYSKEERDHLVDSMAYKKKLKQKIEKRVKKQKAKAVEK